MARPLSYNAFKRELREGTIVHLRNLQRPWRDYTARVVSTTSTSITVSYRDTDGAIKVTRIRWPKASFTSALKPELGVGFELLAEEEKPIGRLTEDGKVVPTGETILAGSPWLVLTLLEAP